jgi:hypothetical protein
MANFFLEKAPSISYTKLLEYPILNGVGCFWVILGDFVRFRKKSVTKWVYKVSVDC